VPRLGDASPSIPCYCYSYPYRRQIYRLRAHRRSKCPPVSAIANLSSHLVSLSATRMRVRHADIPRDADHTLPSSRLSSLHCYYSHGAPDRSVTFSESIFQSPAAVTPSLQASQLSPFQLPKDCLSRLITDQANATPARLPSTVPTAS
jgi:hypothetical protein